MKRRILLALAMICVYGVIHTQVAAVTPTPTGSSSVTVPIATPVSGGIPNKPVQLGVDVSEKDEETGKVNISAGAAMGDTLDTPTYPFAEAFARIHKYLYQLSLQEKIAKPAIEPEYGISGKAKLCIQIGGLTFKLGQRPYITGALPKLRDMIFGSTSLAFLGHKTITPDANGQFQFLPPSQIQAKEAECEETATGTDIQSETKPVAQKYVPLSWSQWFLSLVPQIVVTFVSNTLVPHEATITDSVTSQANTYVPLSIDATNGKTHGSINTTSLVQGVTATMNIPNQAKDEAAMNTIYCSMVPPDKRSNIGLTDADCKREVKKNTPKENCATIDELTPEPNKYSGFGKSNDATLGFSIPMHTTACTVQNIQEVAKFAQQWANKQEGYDNVMKWYPTIEQYAKKFGWNPAFLVALWIEETAAGSVGAHQMGCTYDFGKSGPADPSVCGQLSCIFNYPVRNSTYDFLCSYGSTGQGCTTFLTSSGDNRCFPSNLRGAYQEVVARGSVDTACAPVGQTSKLFRRDCETRTPGGSIFD